MIEFSNHRYWPKKPSYVLIIGVLALVLGMWAALWPLAAGLVGLMLLTGVGLIALWRRPFWIVLFLAAYMPLETFVLTYLPVSDQVYLGAQLFGELLIYSTLAVLLVRRLLENSTFVRTPLDRVLLALILVALLSILINKAPIAGSLTNLRSLLRYVALYYLVINLGLKPEQGRLLIAVIVVSGVAQLIVGVFQWGTNGANNELFLPRMTETEIAGQSRQFRLLTRGREIGSVFGTLGDTLYYGLFILVFLTVYLGRVGERIRFRHFAISAAAVAAVGLSYSRASLFGLVLVLVVFLGVRNGFRWLYLVILLTLPVFALGVITAVASITGTEQEYVNPVKGQQTIGQNIAGVFSSGYLEVAQKQRLGSLLGTAPTALANRPFFGYGPDEETTIDRLNESRPSYLFARLSKRGFEDVYWVALLAYYGLAGVLAVIWLFLALFRSAKSIREWSSEGITKGVAMSVMCTALLTPFLMFFYRLLEFRVYSFYFWLLAATMYSLAVWERQRPGESS